MQIWKKKISFKYSQSSINKKNSPGTINDVWGKSCEKYH